MRKYTAQILLGLAAFSFCLCARSDEGSFNTKGKSKAAVANPVAAPAEVYPNRPGWETFSEINGEPGITGLNRLARINGSTTAIPLAQLIVARALNMEGELRRLPIHRGAQTESLALTFPFDTPREHLEEFQNYWRSNTPQNTHAAYDSLTRQTSSLIIVAREPSADELKLAALQKVEFDIRPLAFDAFVFLTNAKNAVEGLSIEQIRGIYNGQIKNWNEVGGNDKKISAITRDQNSGSQELMQKLVMEELPMISGTDRMASSMMGTLDRVEQSDNTIAYSVYYYERIMNPRATIKPLAVNGVLPTSQTIADRTYPLVEPVYVVIRKDVAADGPAAKLRDWLLSEDGQKIVRQSGYIPVGK